jgi:cell wall-associated NlpC family hydrolase
MKLLSLSVISFFIMYSVSFNGQKTERMQMAEIIVTETDELSIKDSPSEEPRQTYPYWKNEEQRRRLVRLALGFEGTPYVSGGITADGIDCSGLSYIVY